MALTTETGWQIDYDEESDVLYASLGPARRALSWEIAPDILLRYVPPSPDVVGITLVHCLRQFPRPPQVPLDLHLYAVLHVLWREHPKVPL